MKRKIEPAYLLSILRGMARPSVPIIPYIPALRQPPARKLDVVSAWQGIEDILADLIERVHLGTDRCLEFGVEYGFSTVALSSFFALVTGVDTFAGDEHTDNKEDIYGQTLSRLAPYENIHLIRADYRDFIRSENATYDLIHVDIVHTFADTYACGLWSAKHSTCAIFHDTESFPEVKQAVREIARATGKTFYNFNESHGLGILV